MGKHLRQQRRGRGGPVYRSPSHRHKGAIKHPEAMFKSGLITDIVHAPGRSGPLALIDFQGKEQLVIAAEGMTVGHEFLSGPGVPANAGNILPLAALPEGTLVHNVEARPGDGGKFVRTAGSTATVVSKGDKVVLLMPSGSFKTFDPRCRASIGTLAGAGHTEKPFGTSGNKFHAYRSRSKAYFKVKGVAMNPVNHPHGGGSHPHVGKPSTVSRNAPPGRKVGRLSPQKKPKEK
ncbi:MAG: 50S ribosomal protein L2 [Methanomassiliicoccales archaeon]|nr:50S ribosomal protein L2 [Methanomassiliicoccales archaeon]